MIKVSVSKVLFYLLILCFFSTTLAYATDGESNLNAEEEFSESEILPSEEDLTNLGSLLEGQDIIESEQMVVPKTEWYDFPLLEPVVIRQPGPLVPTQPGLPVYDTDAVACNCSGYGNPVSVKTNTIDMYGTPLEYGFYKGKFMIFERPGIYYYKQQATQTHFNMVTGQFVQKFAAGYSTYVGYKGISKVPYMAKLFDKLGTQKPFNFSDYAKAVSAYQIESKVPLYGKILHTSVPTAGTKEVLVYLSTDNKKWQKRILFTIKNGTVSYKKWYVK